MCTLILTAHWCNKVVNLRLPSWQTVAENLETVRQLNGTVQLSILCKNGFSNGSLEVRLQGGRFILTALSETDDDTIISTFIDPDEIPIDQKLIEILGDEWSYGLTSINFNYVLDAFNEFWKTGKVTSKHFVS
jgi:hypothetical protein